MACFVEKLLFIFKHENNFHFKLLHRYKQVNRYEKSCFAFTGTVYSSAGDFISIIGTNRAAVKLKKQNF
jgi:hypothetical protein